MSGELPASSLAARLVLLFAVGSAFILAGAGYALYHALVMRLEANDVAEMRGKTEAVEHVIRDAASPAALPAVLERLAGLPAGHPRLGVGARVSGEWRLPLEPPLAGAAARLPASHHSPYAEVEAGGRSWLLHHVSREWPGAPPVVLEVFVAIETTETRKLLREHAFAAVLVAILGAAASALLAWFVARRGLAPLAQLAGRAGEVTARRLGERLDLKDAPRELHGLADSINHMLERLEESFRALEQFSGDIAHELRTPLNNLLLQTQVTLSRPRAADEYRDALHSNLEELERLQRMVADMLFLARADRGMIELSLEPIDLRAEIESIAEYFEAAAAEKGQRISLGGQGTARADRLMVRRAVTNLLSNAVRYSPTGAAIEVAIDADPSGSTVTVTNPGEAIPPGELRRLFTRFARRDVARGRELEGAGLGLAIVDSIMKLLGGSVEASSGGGKVCFSLRFPDRKLANS